MLSCYIPLAFLPVISPLNAQWPTLLNSTCLSKGLFENSLIAFQSLPSFHFNVWRWFQSNLSEILLYMWCTTLDDTMLCLSLRNYVYSRGGNIENMHFFLFHMDIFNLIYSVWTWLVSLLINFILSSKKLVFGYSNTI